MTKSVARCGYTGEDGVELSCPADQTQALAEVTKYQTQALAEVIADQTQALAEVTKCQTKALADVIEDQTQAFAEVTKKTHTAPPATRQLIFQTA